jgi:hypothetical protein
MLGEILLLAAAIMFGREAFRMFEVAAHGKRTQFHGRGDTIICLTLGVIFSGLVLLCFWLELDLLF